MLQRLPSGTVFEQIAAIASVDPSRVDTLRAALEPFILQLWGTVATFDRLPEFKQEVERCSADIEQAQACFDKLCDAAYRFLEAEERVSDGFHKLHAVADEIVVGAISARIADARDIAGLPERIVSALAHDDTEARVIAILAQNGFERRPQRPEPERRARSGRRVGSRRHQGFRRLVVNLLSAVDSAGGKLTFFKEYPDRGTLWPALQLLAPLLPPGGFPLADVIPEKIWLSRVRTAHKAWAGSRPGKKSVVGAGLAPN